MGWLNLGLIGESKINQNVKLKTNWINNNILIIFNMLVYL